MTTITINGISINPEAQQDRPEFATLMADDSAASDYVIIQTKGPLNREQRQVLTSLGVQILEYVSDSAYICRYRLADLDAIRELPFVEWANVYLEGFKIPAGLRASSAPANGANLLDLGEVVTSMSQDPKQVIVVLHKDADAEAVREEIAAAARIDPAGLQFSGNAARLTVQPQDLEELAAIDAVRHIEEYSPPKLHNNVALGLIHADEVHQTVNLQGEGEVIAICDTGFDRGTLADIHPAFAGRVLKLYPLGRPQANDPHGHGTHVAGSALGDGLSSSMGGAVRGSAPRARLVLQSVLDETGGLGGLPFDLTELFRRPYEEDGARIHSNSWGVRNQSLHGRYTANAEQIDRFIWEHRDSVICFSAGNEGSDGNADGIVDNGSITPPSTAKNCITVGASENQRPNQSKSYGTAWPGDFPANPLASDLWADNPNGMAAFSSRGPTNNGRIKPDLVAPGTAVLSARSRDAAAGTFWGISSDPLYNFKGGTSMATPLVAGCAAVAREYLRSQGVQRPSAALVKAMLINGAGDIQGQYNPSEAGGFPNLSEGFGRVNLAATVGPHPADRRLLFQEENGLLDTGDAESINVTIASPGASLKVTLVWSDPPGEALQNDLDLIVQAANGEERHGNMPGNTPAGSLAFDRANNVEQVLWENIPTGNVQVSVRAHRITLHPQSYALVVRVENDAADNLPEASDVALGIDNVELTQSGVNELTAAVNFQLTGNDADAASNTAARFRIQLALLNLDSAGSQTVASDEGQLQPGVLAYRWPLRFPIPPVGRYRLRSRVSLELPDGERTAEFDGPSFRVIR